MAITLYAPMHAIQRMEREGSSHTRLHTHKSVHCGYRDMMSILYTCCYRIEISHYIRLTCGHSNCRHTMYYDTVKVEILGSEIFSVNGKRHGSIRRYCRIRIALGVHLLECTRGECIGSSGCTSA